MHLFRPIIPLVVSMFLLLGCEHKPARKITTAFYYWKSNGWDLDKEEAGAIRDHKARQLYVKFFEVAKDELYGAVPEVKTNFRFNYYEPYGYSNDTLLDSVFVKMEIVPVVFVRNEVLKNVNDSFLDTLASNICFLADKYYNERIQVESGAYKELQIDCDWTKSTKENYFKLLTDIKKRSAKKISCTLRLYPYKYPDVMGVPPVDKVMLMCYNLINPLDAGDRNSILDTTELEAYLKGAKKYPLHMDVALPVFSWYRVFHDGQLMGMMDCDAIDTSLLEKEKQDVYSVRTDTLINNYYLREGDELRLEEVNGSTMKRMLSVIDDDVELDDSLTVSLFDLDAAHLQRYKNETIDSCFSYLAH